MSEPSESDERPLPSSIERWQTPALDGSDGQGFMTASRLQELQQAAWDEAYEKGRNAGEQAGQALVSERVDRLEQLLLALGEPFERLDAELEEQLVELCTLIVKQLFRRELRLDPTHIVGVVRESVKLLPAASRDVRVQLHPDDADLIRESLADTDGDRSWSIVEDPLMGKGGCRIATENSAVDAEAETRLNVLLSSIVGDERQA